MTHHAGNANVRPNVTRCLVCFISRLISAASRNIEWGITAPIIQPFCFQDEQGLSCASASSLIRIRAQWTKYSYYPGIQLCADYMPFERGTSCSSQTPNPSIRSLFLAWVVSRKGGSLTPRQEDCTPQWNGRTPVHHRPSSRPCCGSHNLVTGSTQPKGYSQGARKVWSPNPQKQHHEALKEMTEGSKLGTLCLEHHAVFFGLAA